MKEKKAKVPKQKKSESKKDSKPQKKEAENTENEDFDFGGIPKNIPFKRNIGCGG